MTLHPLRRLFIPLLAGLLLAGCAPSATAPGAADPVPAPGPVPPVPTTPVLRTGEVWTMLAPGGAQGQLQVARSLTVGQPAALDSGSVAYVGASVPTVTGSTQDAFTYIPAARGPAMLMARFTETTFDLRFYDFCVVANPVDTLNQPQTGMYLQGSQPNALRDSRRFGEFSRAGQLPDGPTCTLTRVR